MARKPKAKLDSPAAKVMAVLETVARLRAVPLHALAEHLDLPTPTAHRICRELERLGWLQRLPGTRMWTVARALVGLSADTLAGAANSAAAQAILRTLTREIGEMCTFAVQVDDEVVYIASAEAPQELTLSFRAGRKAPLFCTSSGRLFLARLDHASLARYLESAQCPAFTRYTVTDPKKLLAIIRRVRAAGHAVTEQEYMLHVVGAGVPVIGPDDAFYGVLSVAAPDVRCSTKRLEQLLPMLKRAAAHLAEHLAAQPTEGRPEASGARLQRSSGSISLASVARLRDE
jgi:IclR family transcriptional regulator, acetate operon repressor